ncbi:MAG: hypothetical protein U9Q68_00125 [Euryarchaeota archaeon]|nr:hypothetical protein [Euryarchaeota archaeon]
MSSTRHETIKSNNLREFGKYQTDSLFLLIGTNPLPNYVAFRLLAKPECHIYFVHTEETGKIANRLVDAMGLPSDRWTKILVKDSDANDIFTKIHSHAKDKNGLGLNYTGGTKSMAVHSYRAILDVDPDAIFSYLDARRLELTVDRVGASSIRRPVGLSVRLSMEALLTLHGRTPDKLNKDPFQPDVCRELVAVPHTELRNWCNNNLRSGTHLKKKQDPKTELPPFENLSKYWDGCETLGELAVQWGKKIGSLARWFDGKWLEHYTLWAVQQVAQECGVHDAVWNLEPEKNTFDLDVAALRGYQLFAISCTTVSNKGLIKQKLFEAYIRARQLGGDEARVGIVCFAPSDNPESNPARIKQEIEEEWDANGKFRVYGVADLPNIPAHLREWFNSQ